MQALILTPILAAITIHTVILLVILAAFVGIAIWAIQTYLPGPQIIKGCLILLIILLSLALAWEMISEGIGGPSMDTPLIR